MGKRNSKLKSDSLEKLKAETYCKCLLPRFCVLRKENTYYLCIYDWNTYFFITVSEKEIKQWHKGFLKDCPNGLLTEQGFIKIYTQFFPNGDPTKFASLVFRVFDENQDGSIEFEEFIRALSITSRGNLDEKLNCKFTSTILIDLNDGHIVFP